MAYLAIDNGVSVDLEESNDRSLARVRRAITKNPHTDLIFDN